MISHLADSFGIIANLVLAAIGLIIAYAWIVLPFKVVRRLNKIVAATERAADAAERALPRSTPEEIARSARIPGINA